MIYAINRIPTETLFASDFFDEFICDMVQEDQDSSISSLPIHASSESQDATAPSLQQVPSQGLEKGVDLELQDKLDSLLGF